MYNTERSYRNFKTIKNHILNHEQLGIDRSIIFKAFPIKVTFDSKDFVFMEDILKLEKEPKEFWNDKFTLIEFNHFNQ
jgi:hypothetical protein